MPGIFDNELHETGQFWPNPYRTRPLSPLSIVADGLKWRALRRRPRLVSNERGYAGTSIVILNRP